MRGNFFYATALMLFSFSGLAKNKTTEVMPEIKERIDSVVVSSSRASRTTPVTFTMIGKKDLRRNNPINSIPMSLNLQPSIIATNEGGTGLGYSKMSVRGVSGSQINVTLNGITLNDSESQEVFWVNIPALTNILSSVQLQRGLGTSANGAGAFGASINMNTASVGISPSANIEYGRGAWNTSTITVSAGTGLTKSGLYASFAYSKGTTDGYIRNAFANVQSAFAALGWISENNSLRITYLMGNQHTGITWNGIPIAKYKAGDYTYNEAGAYKDQFNNIRYYNNDTDNYAQHHLQINYTHRFSENLFWSTTANWTKGDGYYEEYKADTKVKKFGYKPIKIGEKQYKKGDFIVRKQMDNSYYVLNSNLKYNSDRLSVIGGIYGSIYKGGHFGNVIWSNLLGDNHDYSDGKWYDNNSVKKEASVFARAEYHFNSGVSAYTDLQYRGISYKMAGPDDKFIPIDYSQNWHFFNPRVGISYVKDDFLKVYASAAFANREPGRPDLKEKIRYVYEKRADKVSLKPEKMLDIELGFDMNLTKNFSYSANLYMMEYSDMLLETGILNDVGYAIKANTPRSYRRGIELSAVWQILPEVCLDANLALSTNKIKNYDVLLTLYDNPDNYNYLGTIVEKHYDKVTMLNSPSVIAMSRLTVLPFKRISKGIFKNLSLSMDGKYVGKQYWDNTENSDRMTPGYFISNLSVSQEFNIGMGKLGFAAYLNNIFNNRYFAYGWVSRSKFKENNLISQYEGVYPQAPFNCMLKMYLRF